MRIIMYCERRHWEQKKSAYPIDISRFYVTLHLKEAPSMDRERWEAWPDLPPRHALDPSVMLSCWPPYHAYNTCNTAWWHGQNVHCWTQWATIILHCTSSRLSLQVISLDDAVAAAAAACLADLPRVFARMCFASRPVITVIQRLCRTVTWINLEGKTYVFSDALCLMVPSVLKAIVKNVKFDF